MQISSDTPNGPALKRFAWFVLAYTVLVILFGGYVRATGSGAGCGSHWPLCNGEVLPRDAGLETVIEFTHRITSGLAFLLLCGLFVWIWRSKPRGSGIRTSVMWAMVFMVLESLIGAGLVLFELVAYNVSVARAYWMVAHLTNTFLLLGAMTLTVWKLHDDAPIRIRGQRVVTRIFWPTLAAWFVLGASGAAAALGDTLSIGGGIDPETNPVVATLVGLRLVHPALAVLTTLLLLSLVYVGFTRREGGSIRPLGMAIAMLLVLQLAIGLVNVWLRAPVSVQLIHLFVTDVLWIVLVLFGAAVLSRGESVPGPSAAFSEA